MFESTLEMVLILSFCGVLIIPTVMLLFEDQDEPFKRD